MSNIFEFTDRLGFNPPENSIGSRFPQFPIPFDFTTLNVSQLANKYYGNNAVLEKKGLKVYADQDTENLFNNGDPETLEEVIVYSNNSYMEFEDFNLSLFTSTNGVTLLQQFKEVEVSSDEVVVFLEIDNPTNFFGTVMRIKVGSNLKGRKDLPYSEIIDFAQDKGISVSPNRIKRLLKKGVKSKKNLFKWVLSSIAKTIGKAVEFVSGEVGDLFFQTIPEAIDKIRISENRWNPSLEGYNGIFIPDKFEKYIANLKDDEKGGNSILKAFVSPFFKQINRLEGFTKGKLKKVKSYIPGKVYRKLKKVIDYLFGKINGLEDIIYDSKYELLKLILTALEAANSFLCGLYNSIIDTVKGIFQIVGLVFKGIEAAADFTSNLGYYASLSIEFIENIIEGILEIDFVELFKQLFFLPLVIIKKVVSFTINQSSLTIQEFYYYIGYIVGFIVETVVSILFTGGSLSVGKVLAKTFKEPVEFLLKGFKGIVSASKSLVNKVISAVQYIIKKLKNPKQLAADFLRFIEDLFGAGKKNFDDLFKRRSNWMSSGLFRFGDDAATMSNAIKLAKRTDDGWFNVLAHGSSNSKHFIINGRKLKPDEFANLLIKKGYKLGDPIRLVVCYAGAKPNGIAAKLSKLLKAKVQAPTDKIRLDNFSEFEIFNKGEFVIFNP